MCTERLRLFEELVEDAARPDPYPILARMREERVVRGPGLYGVTRYRDIHALLRDKRISSDPRKAAGPSAIWTNATPHGRELGDPPFIFLDPPDHTRIRSLVVKEFRPRVIARLQHRIVEITHDLLDAVAGNQTLELVGDFALPLPVTVLCEFLGVPREHVPRFQDWSRAIAHALDPGPTMTEKQRVEGAMAVMDMAVYCRELAEERRAAPRDDCLSALVRADQQDGALSEHDLITTIGLLLVAGHETTVNLISNAMLALLRHPETLHRVRSDPALAPAVVEETLRYDSPVQIRNRVALEEIEIDGTVIPAGSNVVLIFGAGNRDPEQYPEPDRFDITRNPRDHLGFGGGPHFCLGAALARIESSHAVEALSQRLVAPRLLEDPPPYRPNAALRGPERLDVAVDGLRPAPVAASRLCRCPPSH